MTFTVLTLFPELIEGVLKSGLLGQALNKGLASVSTLNPRQFTSDVHHTVDDRAFGGSDGMVMKLEPLVEALESLRAKGPCHAAVLSPQGPRWTQARAVEYSARPENIVLICGRYAGIDQRLSAFVEEEISLGDFVLNGGELAACAVMESVIRLAPGALGNKVSAVRDSFMDGLLECPQFTRPQEFRGLLVPSPLLSGHHEKIARFHQNCALVRTALLRPDLQARTGEVAKAATELEALPDLELKALQITRAQLKGLKL